MKIATVYEDDGGTNVVAVDELFELLDSLDVSKVSSGNELYSGGTDAKSYRDGWNMVKAIIKQELTE